MAQKVTFDATNRRIVVTTVPVSGTTILDFSADIYSAGKGDWLSDSTLSKLIFPIRAIGGDSLPGGLKYDSTYFLKTPWKVLPHDSDHELVIKGNVFTDDGSQFALSRSGRTIAVRLVSTFSAGASVPDIAEAVHADGRSLTVGKFIALK